jgi:hypothetical protein
MVLLISSCSSSGTPVTVIPYTAPAPKGLIIEEATVSEIKARLLAACADNDFVVSDEQEHLLRCRRSLDFTFGSALYRSLMTPKYSTNPEITWQFLIFTDGATTRVVPSHWIEYQNAFGQVTRDALNDPQSVAGLRQIVGAYIPVVSKAPASSLRVERLRLTVRMDSNTGGVFVKNVDEESDAAGKGVQPGDRIETVGTTQITSTELMLAVVNETGNRGKNVVLLYLNRNGARRYVAVKLAP